MKRVPDYAFLLLALLGAAAVFLARRESGATLAALLGVVVLYLAHLAIAASTVNEANRRELLELRVALATLGDPDKLLRRLDDLQERVEKAAKLPERVDELQARIQKLAGDTGERLTRIEGPLHKLLTEEGLGRRMKFGQ